MTGCSQALSDYGLRTAGDVVRMLIERPRGA